MQDPHAWKGPVKASPDFDNLLAVLRRERPDRPTLFEFFLNDTLHRRILGDEAFDAIARAHDPHVAATLIAARAYRTAGYDCAITHASAFRFMPPQSAEGDARSISINVGAGITDRSTFEAFDWPEPEDHPCRQLDVLQEDLPDGMGVILEGPGGVLENVIALVGYENLAFLLADDPDLGKEIFDAVGSRLLRYYEMGLAYDCVRAIISNDDWGFKTQTMLSAEQLARYVFGWHERIVAAAHAKNRPAILHSCGRLDEVMDDVIDRMHFDAKHSYEDAIVPVEQAYERWGGRIAILGGIDLDFVCRAGPAEVYRRSRDMLQRAAHRGGYALGTGNSVPDYVPEDAYFAMIEAALGERR